MVTEIILNENIAPGYLDIDYWILHGITNDAVCLCVNLSDGRNDEVSRFSYSSMVRNKRKSINIKYIPPTRW